MEEQLEPVTCPKLLVPEIQEGVPVHICSDFLGNRRSVVLRAVVIVLGRRLPCGACSEGGSRP